MNRIGTLPLTFEIVLIVRQTDMRKHNFYFHNLFSSFLGVLNTKIGFSISSKLFISLKKTSKRLSDNVIYCLGNILITLAFPLIANASTFEDLLKSTADRMIQKALTPLGELDRKDAKDKVSNSSNSITENSSGSVVRFIRFSSGGARIEDPAAYSKGSMQVRIGHGYSNNEANLGSGDQWLASCDIYYIVRTQLPSWSPKVHQSGDSQDQFCALNELQHAARSGPRNAAINNVNLRDSFARRDIIQEFSKVVELRKSEIKAWDNKPFFFLTDGVDVSTYDFTRQTYTVSVYLPPMGWYQKFNFSGDNIRGDYYKVTVNVNEALARKIEKARSGSGFISKRPRVDFTISAVREAQGMIQLDTRIDSLTIPVDTGAETFNWVIDRK